jgi:hypothetical protein
MIEAQGRSLVFGPAGGHTPANTAAFVEDRAFNASLNQSMGGSQSGEAGSYNCD